MCLKSLATIFLFAVNIAFFLGGGVLLAVGIIAFVEEDLLYQITDLLTDALSKVIENIDVLTTIDLAGLIKANAIILLVVGGVLFIFGFLGVCGACKKNATLLKVYATLVTISVMAEVGLSVYAYMYGAQFEKTIQDGLKLALYKTYKEGLRETNVSSVLNSSLVAQEFSIDILQIELKCCGVSNHTEWQEEGVVWNSTYEITFTPSGTKETIVEALHPPSCCILNDTSSKDTGFKAIPVSHFVDLQGCLVSGVEAHTTPCFDRVKKLIKDNEDLVIIIFAVIVGIQLLSIIIACFLKPSKG